MKVLSGVFLLCLFLAATPALAENGGNSYYEQAVQLRSEGRLPEAEQAFLKAIQEEPTNADYHFELSNIYAALYDQSSSGVRGRMLLERSEHELVQTLTFRPDHLPARFNLGIVYKREGKYEKAREEFRRALELSPQLAAAWYQIGVIYEEQKFWDEAQDAYLRAREIGGDTAEIEEALNNLQHERLPTPSQDSALGGLGALGGGASGFSNGLLNTQRTDPYGRPLSPYDNSYGNGQPSGAGNGSVQSALPSLAAMMIQQFLSRRSQNNNQ